LKLSTSDWYPFPSRPMEISLNHSSNTLRRFLTALFAIPGTAILAFAAQATTIQVPGDAPTIQAGVDLAAFGDTVEVACGTYTAGAILKDGIVVRSETGLPDCVSIRINGNLTAFRCVDAFLGIKLEGIRMIGESGFNRGLFCRHSTATITNCDVQGFARTTDEGNGDGAGMRIEAGSSVLLDHCEIADTFSDMGAGIHCLASSLSMEDCEVQRNVAYLEGGGIQTSASVLDIRNTLFEENSSPYTAGHGSVHGGGISASAGSMVTIIESTFLGNSAGYFAGAICSTEGTLSVADCIFENNSTGISSAGAILMSDGVVERSVFRSNAAGWNGGAVQIASSGAPILRECLFEGNIGHFGGAAAVSIAAGNVVIESCTLVKNYGEGAGGSTIDLSNSATLELRNSIVAFSTSGAAVSCMGASAISSTCSDIYGNFGGDWVSCVAGQESFNGNISADPYFCDTTNGEYTLQANSPCAPPQSGACGLIGVFGVGCNAVSVNPPVNLTSWGAIKALYR